MFFWKTYALRRAAAAALAADHGGKLAALDRAQAVAEFTPDGEVLSANTIFLAMMGYAAEEIVGRHHGMFVEPAVRDSHGDREFWSRLRQGEFFSMKFKRIAKDGRPVWIQGSYCPVLDPQGKPVKVMKFATDVTAAEEERLAQDARLAEAALVQQQVVSALAEGLGRLSEADLQVRLSVAFPPAYEKVRSDFNAALQTLAETMAVVIDNAAAIHAGTQEISAAADDLSRRTEQQAASLEETTAALGEITATVRRTSEGANHARKIVSAAKRDAEQSGQVVCRAVEAMGKIETSSSQISQIIGVIDEIAFQTNLLALNAGVEAARAGDAGRGFAVVASEVRALAQRSAEAAKEIKALILASTQQVTAGVSLVGQTGKALDGIVGQITEINELVSTIASSAQEQATALDQINIAVVQMDQVTQQNAAMVEQATAASHNLAQEADTLSRLVGRFQADQPAPARAPRPMERRPAAKSRSAAPATALKTVGRGGAARKPAPAAAPAADDWEEF